MAVKLNSTGGGSVTLDSPSTASNYTVTLPSAAGTLATTTGTGSVFTNPTINGFTGDTSAITIGTTQFVKDASGNIGIGTATPGSKLQVQGAATVVGSSATNNAEIRIQNTDSGGATWRIGDGIATANGNLAVYRSSGSILGTVLDASGNLGLGVTPSAWSSAKAYQVGGYAAYAQRTTGTSDLSVSWNATITSGTSSGLGYVYRNTGDLASAYEQNGGHRWYIAPSGTAGNAITFNQAMTLDASGRLIVGTTSQNGFFTVDSAAANTNMASFAASNTSGPNYVLSLQSYASAANTGAFIRAFVSTTTLCFNVAGNGNVTNTNSSYGAISDRSLKENIVDATPKLVDLLKVKIRNFNLIGDSTKQIGVVAQELEEVFPAMVEEDKDGIKSVKYSVFTPMLLKAIQELSAQNNALEARLAKLEAK